MPFTGSAGALGGKDGHAVYRKRRGSGGKDGHAVYRRCQGPGRRADTQVRPYKVISLNRTLPRGVSAYAFSPAVVP